MGVGFSPTLPIHTHLMNTQVKIKYLPGHLLFFVAFPMASGHFAFVCHREERNFCSFYVNVNSQARKLIMVHFGKRIISFFPLEKNRKIEEIFWEKVIG